MRGCKARLQPDNTKQSKRNIKTNPNPMHFLFYATGQWYRQSRSHRIKKRNITKQSDYILTGHACLASVHMLVEERDREKIGCLRVGEGRK